MTPRVRSLMGIASTWILFQAGLALAAPVTPPEAAYVPGELIVKYRPSVEVAQRSALRGAVRAQLIRRLDLISAEHVRLAEGASMEAAIARLSGDPRVEYVQPNYRWHADVIPNDPRFPEQWSLLNTGQTAGTPGDDIHATQAWDVYTGDPNMKIGVIDSGVDYDHPDLAANIWTNPGEIPGNGLDDDDNGYVDDVHGYDVINDDGDPIDDNGHGTHVSGIIAGVGNNALGVAGVVWRAKLVTIKFLGADGFGSTAGAIASVQYAVTVGVRLTNNSWGGGAFDQALLDAINAAGQAGQLFVAAAGNNANDNDVNPLYPATYDTPYVLSVAATDQNDDLILLSNYGATTVDIAAPGQRILSCAPGGDYALRSGTSMAAPHASGAVAMAMGRLPGLTHLQIKQLLLYFADPRPQLAGKVLSGGRLNAFLPVAAPDSVHPSGIADLAVTDAGSNTLGLSWTAPGDDGMTGRVTSYEIRWSLTPLNPLNFSSATLVPGPDPLPGGSLESFEIGGLGFNATYYVGIRGLDEYFNAGPVSNFVSGTTLGIPNAEAGPASAGMVLAVGQNRDTVVTLSNTAAGTLDFTIPSPQVLFAQEGHPYQPHDKVLGDFRTGPPVVNGTGGPDGFGYRWSDSHQSGGPTFDWVDITATGTLLPLVGDDELSPPLPLGFDFPFYGNVFDSVRVCTNGFLTFTGTLAPFDNQPLPSAFAPPNLIAPLWDDLNFGITPRVYLQSDGTRAIVSWVGVPHHPDLGPYTFQVILFPSGEIRYQYLSIGIPSNSATVGIQNQSASAGLTVAFNATYLHDSLAVRLGRLQQWLSVTPASGRVPAGQSLPLQVHFDAASLLGGHYDGSFDVLSNDPDGSPLTVPAHLQVIGVPNVATNPATLDFGTVVIGDSVSRTLVLENVGSDTLFVTGFDCGDAAFAVADTAMTLGPLRNGVVAVKFHPISPGPVQSSLEIASNDPDAPIFLVPLVGSVVTPPQILVGPDSQHVALATTLGPEALVSDRPLVIHNLGGAPLTWNLTTTSGLPLAQIADPGTGMARAAPPIRPFDELPKDDPGTPGPPVTATAGGPDLFGYRWVSSDDPGGPPFAWQEISTVGTEVVFDRDDQTLGPFPLPFTFNFYGVPYTSFRLCSNFFFIFTWCY